MNQYIGKSCGGNTSKINAVVDGLGKSVKFKLYGCKVNVNTVEIDLLSTIDIKGAYTLWAIKLTELKITVIITLHKKSSIQFRYNRN